MQQKLKTNECKPGCDCPACTGLQCFDRPRFFTGQLLTEAELNDMQEYGIAKQKLHNRYLHGCGIVCGLEVTCHDCDSEFVTVHPGLALDCCGNEIVVCEAVDFNVIKAIAQCRKAEKKNCDPWRTPVARNCDDIEQDWCITIRYREQLGKPTTALVSQTSGKCGCGKKGKNCTYGCGGGSAVGGGGGGYGMATTTMPRSAQTCEPQRIIEGFELGVVCLPTETDTENENAIVQYILETLGKLGIHIPLECLMECVTDLMGFAQELIAIINMLNDPNAFVNRFQIESRFCRLLESIRRHLLHDTLTKCELIQQLNAINCPSAPNTPNEMPTFVSEMQAALIDTAELLMNLFINCICYEVLPKCPPEVCEDRLLLACVTVRDGRVIRVCHEPRTYVLTAHNAVSAVLSVLLRDLCCQVFEFPDRGDDTTDTTNNFRSPTMAASYMGASYKSPVAGVVANVMRNMNVGDMFASRTTSFAAADRVERVARPTIEPNRLTGLHVDSARERLTGVETNVERANWSPAEAFLRGLSTSDVRADQPVRLYVDDQNRVIGMDQAVESERLRSELDQANARITRLEEQIAALLNR
jgi:hypothetical protein